MTKTKVLVVTGRSGGKIKEEIKALMKDVLEQAGHEVLTAQNTDEALYLVYHKNVVVMITEVDITGYQDGVELIRAVHDINHGTTRTILTSGRYVEELIELAHLAGATAYWSRPSSMDSLAHLVGQILQDEVEVAAETTTFSAPAMA